MEIIYCDQCGHRIPDDDFTKGLARKTETQNFCAKCAPAAVKPPEPQNIRMSSARMSPLSRMTPDAVPMPAPMTQTVERVQRDSAAQRLPSGANPVQRQSGGLLVPGIVVGVVGAALAVVIGLATAKTPPPEPPPESTVAHNTPEVKPDVRPHVPAPAPEPQRPDTPPKDPGSTQKPPDPEAIANAALIKALEDIPANDYKARITRLHEFMEKFPDTQAAAKAVLLDKDYREKLDTQASARPSPPPGTVVHHSDPAKTDPSKPAPKVETPKRIDPKPVVITPLPDATAALLAFELELLGLLKKRDKDGVDALLKRGAEDPQLADAHKEISLHNKAPALLADLETAVQKGVEALKEVDSFTLKRTNGDLYVGKTRKVLVTALQEGKLTIEGHRSIKSIAMADLTRDTLDRIAQLGLAKDGPGQVRSNLITILTTAADKLYGPRKFLKAGAASGASEEDLAYLNRLVQIADAQAAENAAKLAFDELDKLYQSKNYDALITGLAAFKPKFAKTLFQRNETAKIREMELNAGLLLNEGLLVYWRLDEESGTAATDASGKGKNGKLEGGKWGPGKIDGGYLGGSGGITSAFLFDTPQVTLSCWVKHDALGGEGERYITVEPEVAVIRHGGNGQLHFYAKLGSDLRHIVENAALNNGQWCHVVGTWDGQTMKLYRNGALVGKKEDTGRLASGTGVRAAARGAGELLKGCIDEVRIYDRALIESEIQILAGVVKKVEPPPK